MCAVFVGKPAPVAQAAVAERVFGHGGINFNVPEAIAAGYPASMRRCAGNKA